VKVVYTAPTRGHHYRYAYSLHEAGYLKAFVSGFPRVSNKVKDYEFNGALYHSDFVQMVYLLSLKGKFPEELSKWLCFLAKKEQDLSCRKFIKDTDIFLFYNGSGLTTSKHARKNKVINVVEVVNSHLTYQENLLEDEYKKIKVPWKPSLQKERTRRLKEYEESDYILVPSEFVKNSFITQGFPQEKLLKVAYGFEKYGPIEKENYQKPDKKSFTILYVGTISVRKGVRYLVEAFKGLKHPNKKLMLVGPNANDGALNGIDVTDNIIFPGVLKRQQLEIAYKSADVFCLPSIEDGFGLVLGEALSFGLPIITTTNTGGDDIISEGKDGFVVPIRDSKAILEKMQMLVDDPGLLKQMRCNSTAKAEKLNGWEESGKNLVNVLQAIHCLK
jgi:glycosyltransferase involved in cell wall biosynthesis